MVGGKYKTSRKKQYNKLPREQRRQSRLLRSGPTNDKLLTNRLASSESMTAASMTGPSTFSAAPPRLQAVAAQPQSTFSAASMTGPSTFSAAPPRLQAVVAQPQSTFSAVAAQPQSTFSAAAKQPTRSEVPEKSKKVRVIRHQFCTAE